MPNFCKHCGARLGHPHTLFCAACGQPVQSASSATFHSQGALGAPAATGTIHLDSRGDLDQYPSFTLGRDVTNQLHLNHPTVSRVHATIEQTGQGRLMRDLNSSNGTYVNGQLLRGGRLLQNGDVIQIGPFKIVYTQNSLTQFTPNGNYRLDALGLTRSVSQSDPLAWLRPWIAGKGAPPDKIILNNVSLSIYPREFVAIVGASGMGKSTLMNALSGFAPAQGQVLVNGDELYKNYAAYCSILGYVPQDDIIHRQLTARSALAYAARLRLPDATRQEIKQRVEQVLAQVGMVAHAATPVYQLSGGQRKRVSIAVELLAEPGLFFLDEPTSGLDPGLEKRMMQTLRDLAQNGHTILLVTHATGNIDLCSQVLFMVEGRLVFFGPPQEALRFFDVPDFADIYNLLAHPVDPTHLPPAGWQAHYRQLQAGAARPAIPAGEFWAYCFEHSPAYQQYVQQRLLQVGVASPITPTARTPGPRRDAFLRQTLVLSQRYFELIRRDRLRLMTLLLVMPIIGCLLLLIAQPYDLTGLNASATADHIQSKMAALLQLEDSASTDEQFQANYVVVGAAEKLLFMLALATNLLGLFGAAYEIVEEDAIYRRERTVNLRILPYLLSKGVILGIFALVQCLLLLGVVRLKVTYPATGIFFSAMTEMYITLVLATWASISLGLLISALARSSGAVIYIILLLLFFQIIFGGAIFELPAGGDLVSRLTMTRWTLEALGSSVDMPRLETMGASCVEFEDEQTRRMLDKPEPPCTDGQLYLPVPYEFAVDYSSQPGHLLLRWLVLILFIVGFGAAVYHVQKGKDLL